MLRASSRPVLYAGGGCNSPEAAGGMESLLGAFPMPVVTSLMGIGSIRSDHPHALGMVGMHGSVAANRAMYESDLVLAAGVRFDDRATGVIARFCPGAKIIHVDIDAAEVNKILPANLAIISDAESVFPVLSGLLGNRIDGDDALSSRRQWIERLASLRDEETSSFRAGAQSSGAVPGAVHPGAFIASIPDRARREGLDPDSIIVTTDVGQHQMWAAQHYPVMRPRRFLTSGSLGTMGFGLPVAIGAAVANPGKRVVCISGDGSIMMNVQELATLAELDLDVTVIVLDNGVLGMVRQQQALLFKGNYSASVFERRPDLVRIAEGFGITSVSAESPGWERVAFAGSGPSFVSCPIGKDEMVFPFVPAGKANVEAITGR